MLKCLKKKKKGFTLIELLVVIAVIGLLSSIVLVQLGPVRAKARDARKKQDFAQIAGAMQLCYLDAACGIGEDKYLTSATVPPSVGTYMSSVPLSPTGVAYGWWTNVANDQTYCFWTTLEQGGATGSNTHLCASRAGVLEGTAAPTAIATSCCK